MNSPRGMFHKLCMILTLLGLVGFSLSMRAQKNSNQGDAGPKVDPVVQQNILDWAVQQRGVPDDWTHHRLVFSDPGIEQQAIESGNYEHWLKVVNSPRFIMQRIKRSQPPARVKKAALKQDWSMSMGTGTHGTAGVYPAKYSFSTSTGSCSDYVVFPTSAGSSGVPSIIAYTNLYTATSGSCNTGSPTQYWALNLTNSTNYSTVTTSPVLSYDGTEVAFMATINGSAYLVVALMPTVASASTTVTSETTTTCGANTTVNSASQGSSPVVWCAQINGGGADTRSSPFYDYTKNILYVGDNNGKLHKFTTVFKNYAAGSQSSLPSETVSTTSPIWPVTITSASGNETLSSPVYDANSGDIYIGESWANGVRPSLVQVSGVSGTYTVTPSPTTNGNTSGLGGAPIEDPLLDSTAERVYAFIGNDNSSNCTSSCSAVYQFVAGSSSSSFGSTAPVEAYVGTAANSGVSAPPLYAGTFDNSYYTSATGHLYVCGNTSAAPILYAISMSGSGATMKSGNAAVGPTLASAQTTCSPITEVYNTSSGTDDWLFLSVVANGNIGVTGSNSCSGGACVYSFNVASAVPTTTTKANDGIASPGGASGIIIDNVVSTPAGSSQIYYETLGATDAVQTTQSTL